MTRPSLRQIECLLAIRDAGGFSRAAERLGLSQPALSGQIRDLEGLLGLRLVDRTTRRVALTPAGEAFAIRAAAGLAELDRAQAEAQGRAGLSAGRLRLAAPPLLAAGLLPGVMADFARAHPGLDLTLSDLPTDDIVARLRDGRVDAGIGTFPPGLPDLDARPLFRDALMLFAPPGHPLAAMSTVPWAALDGQAVVALGRESGLRLLAELGFDRAGLPLRPAQEVAQVATALALAGAGFGVAVLPGYARIAPQAAGLAARPLDGDPIGRQIAALTPRDRSAPPALAPFLDALARALRRLAPA
jgi:DNA-binding transcriptional LysR family regulator